MTRRARPDPRLRGGPMDIDVAWLLVGTVIVAGFAILDEMRGGR